MDRDAHVRAARRRQVLDALAFEQDREAMLVVQLQDVLTEVEGERLDAGLFAQMSADEAALVRAALGTAESATEPEPEPEPDEAGDDDFGFPADFDDIGVSEHDGVEEEVERLQEELQLSRRAQAALGQYLELLSGPGAV